jgi:hypothetical protein
LVLGAGFNGVEPGFAVQLGKLFEFRFIFEALLG